MYFLIYAYLNILAQSQILGNSLYDWNKNKNQSLKCMLESTSDFVYLFYLLIKNLVIAVIERKSDQ